MSHLTNRAIAIAGADIVSDVVCQSFTNLGTAGTVVAVPTYAHSVQVVGTADASFRPGTALGGSPARIPANSNPRLGFDRTSGSVALAAVSGSANFSLNWHLYIDG